MRRQEHVRQQVVKDVRQEVVEDVVEGEVPARKVYYYKQTVFPLRKKRYGTGWGRK